MSTEEREELFTRTLELPAERSDIDIIGWDFVHKAMLARAAQAYPLDLAQPFYLHKAVIGLLPSLQYVLKKKDGKP